MFLEIKSKEDKDTETIINLDEVARYSITGKTNYFIKLKNGGTIIGEGTVEVFDFKTEG